MAEPGKKRKKLLLIVGMTGVVYVSFKYLLPLVIPFFVAYLAALGLKTPAGWLAERVRFKVGGRQWQMSLGMAGGLELFVILLMLGGLFYVGGRLLCMEIQLLIDRLPAMIRHLDRGLTGWCGWMELTFHLRKGYVVRIVQDMIRALGRTSKEAAMPFLMVNSMWLFRFCIKCVILTVILFAATVLSLQEMDSIRKRRESSMFSREFAMLSRRLSSVGRAYLKTQGFLLVLVTCLCVLGLLLIGNPYYLLLGIAIGLLDALPFFGTGTVLIPWAVICFVRGEWIRGMILAALYLVCYFLREFLEARMMGQTVGLSGLETLAAMYVGLQLFGLLGFILGPVGLLLIEDMVEACCGKNVD